MADLNKIQSAECFVISDGVTQTAALGTAIPVGTESGLIIRDACKGQQKMASSRPVVIASDQSALTVTGSGNFTVIGGKTNNSAAPGATNVGTLPAVCTTAAPTYTTGNQVALSTDTSGNLRVSVTASITQPNNITQVGGSAISLGQKTSANSFPVVIASDQSELDIGGAKTNNSAVPGANNLGTLPAVCTTAAPTYTTGNQVALSTDTSGNLRVTFGGTSAVNITQVGGSAIALGQTTMANSLPVTIASNQSAITVAQATAANLNAVVQGNQGNNTAGPGTNNLGVLPAVCTTAAPTYTTGNQVALSTDTSGALRVTFTGGSSAVNIAQVGGSTVSLGQTTMANSFPVVIASDQSDLDVVGNVAAGTTDSGAPVKIGGVARTTNPTAVTNGQRSNIMTDKMGRLVTVGSQVRDLVTSNQVTLTTTTETTLLAAGGAGVFHDMVGLIVSNNSAVALSITIRDTTGGTAKFFIDPSPNNTGGNNVVNLAFNPPLPQTTANTNWTVQLGTAVTNVHVFIMCVKNT